MTLSVAALAASRMAPVALACMCHRPGGNMSSGNTSRDTAQKLMQRFAGQSQTSKRENVSQAGRAW